MSLDGRLNDIEYNAKSSIRSMDYLQECPKDTSIEEKIEYIKDSIITNSNLLIELAGIIREMNASR